MATALASGIPATATTSRGFVDDTIPVADGMRRTIAWLDANNKIENSERDPLYDRLIDAWKRLSSGMAQEFAGLDR